MNFAESLKEEILSDQYFLALFKKAEIVVTKDLFSISQEDKLTQKEYKDLMRFADILSHSEDSNARNKSYKIISLLVRDFGEEESFGFFAGAILAKLGNFPALKFLNDLQDNPKTLPLERQIEKNVKIETQKTSNGEGVFTDAQHKIRSELEAFDYFSFSGPTSIGKSFILKDYIRYLLDQEQSSGGSIVILVPTRALITQVASELRKEIEDKNVNIASHPIVTSYSLKKYSKHIFVFTPERLLGYISSGNLPIKYLFVDEAQKVVASNDSRSSLYYHAIFETVRKFAAKIVFASPNIPNPEIFLKLFEKDEKGALAITEQTVAQNRYFIDLESKSLLLLSDLGNEISIEGFNFRTDSNKILRDLGENVNNIVYCNGVSETVRRSKAFADSLEKVPETQELRELLAFIAEYVHKDYYLLECLRKGVAFHHGRMPQKVRRKVEEFFQDKNSSLRFVFCTSTLLEGINLPAKNIFVFNEIHGTHAFEKIDFENLIGRAGRLTKEFSGNVICIKDDSKRWKGGAEILRKTDLEKVQSFLLNRNKRKVKEFNNIGKALANKTLATTLGVGEKENMTHFASIVLLHHIEGTGSILKDGFFEKNGEALQILEKAQKDNRVPSEILRFSSTIKPTYQNDVLRFIEKKQGEAALYVTSDNNEQILHALETLYELYNWKVEESGGRDPLIPAGLIKAGYGTTRLKYWAMLLRNWIKSEPLNRLITFSINYHADRGVIWSYENGKPEKERFIGNQKQINLIIEQIMSDIENGLRFKIEKYFKNYYLLSKHVLGEENAGQDWAEFIEYGTTDKRIVELQNLGISRGTSRYLLLQHGQLFSFDEEGTLLSIKMEELAGSVDKKSEHYQEIEEILL